MYIRASFYPGGVYHVYNRGVAKQDLFLDDHDRRHFLETLSFYLASKPPKRFSKTSAKLRRELWESPPDKPLVTILAYCLMSNHFHLVIREEVEHGLSEFMRRAMDSYTRAFNTKYRRVGTIYQGVFSAVAVTNDFQLLQVSRYVHLNPVVARMVKSALQYDWSSFQQYVQGTPTRLVDTDTVLGIAGSPTRYTEFVNDHAAYAQELHAIKSLLIDVEH